MTDPTGPRPDAPEPLSLPEQAMPIARTVAGQATPRPDVPDSQINWPLIDALKGKPHPNLPNPGPPDLPLGVGEVLQEARIAQHLLDMIGIPLGAGYGRDLDARTYLAVRRMGDLEERLARISAWHDRESGPGGLVGDRCVACGEKWPCETRRMAESGTEATEKETPDVI